MHRLKNLPLIILYLAFPISLLANTATIKVYTALIDYENFFSVNGTDLLSYELDDSGLVSGKVKASGSMLTDGVYTTFTAEIDTPVDSFDNNQNGILDFYEPDQSFNTSLFGTVSAQLQGYGSFSSNLFASISRIGSQHSFNLNETVTVQSSTINGIYPGQTEYVSETFDAIHALGTITYDRDNKTYNYSLGYYGTTGSSSGSGTYLANNDNSLTFSEFTFPSMNESSMASSFPGLSQKNLNGSVTIPYVNNNKFHVMTAFSDVPYYVVIEDYNDQDSDGLPDIIPPIGPPAVRSLAGKIYEETYYDDYNSEQITETIYFPSSNVHFQKEVGQSYGFLHAKSGTYNWSTDGSQGTLSTFDSRGVGTYTLQFESEGSGISVSSFPGQNSIMGTFTLTDATSLDLPNSLTGMIYTESYFEPDSQENFIETLHFYSDSQVRALYIGENSGPSLIENYTYTWSSSANLGNLVIVYPPDPNLPQDGYSTGTYSLFFESETKGTSHYSSSDNYFSSGTFSIGEDSTGWAPIKLENEHLVISGKTYKFGDNGIATIRTSSGSIDSPYLYIKTGPDTALVQISTEENAEPQGVENIELLFTSSDGGKLSDDLEGTFSYYPEGTSPPEQKGWMWFNNYPWVYSHLEGGWLYYAPVGNKLMIYSAQNKNWYEMK
jgi:hypothetical protein